MVDVSMPVANAVALSKSIIAEFHKHFLAGGTDNYEHVMAIKRIITATCRYCPNASNEVKRELLDYALALFEEEWLRQAKEEGDRYDRGEEVKEARKIFLQIYKTEKDVW
jgi:hypothetical protein